MRTSLSIIKQRDRPKSLLGRPLSVELLPLQRCALLSLRLPARCFDCSAISLTLPGPLMRRLEAAWLPFSVVFLPLQRCALLSLRLPARCFDCSAISLTLPGPLMRRLEAAWLPFFRRASHFTALRAAQPTAAGSLLRLLRNLADAHPGRWCGIWKSHGFSRCAGFVIRR